MLLFLKVYARGIGDGFIKLGWIPFTWICLGSYEICGRSEKCFWEFVVVYYLIYDIYTLYDFWTSELCLFSWFQVLTREIYKLNINFETISFSRRWFNYRLLEMIQTPPPWASHQPQVRTWDLWDYFPLTSKIESAMRCQIRNKTMIALFPSLDISITLSATRHVNKGQFHPIFWGSWIRFLRTSSWLSRSPGSNTRRACLGGSHYKTILYSDHYLDEMNPTHRDTLGRFRRFHFLKLWRIDQQTTYHRKGSSSHK